MGKGWRGEGFVGIVDLVAGLSLGRLPPRLLSSCRVGTLCRGGSPLVLIWPGRRRRKVWARCDFVRERNGRFGFCRHLAKEGESGGRLLVKLGVFLESLFGTSLLPGVGGSPAA